MREEQLVGLQYLDAVTTLLQRVRRAHPTKGTYEAADLQWWWRVPRLTDELGQLFWFDQLGRPEAAVIATDWGDWIGLDPILMPDADPALVAHVIERGLAHAGESGFVAVELEADRLDDVLRDVLFGHGFAIKGPGLVETWMAADARPELSPLLDGYRLATRLDTTPRPHHFIKRSGPDVEERLLQTSLYRPDLDLVILDGDDNYAASGLFWYDPETGTGLVEPMRTEDEHQRRGLARHVLTAGLELLANAGAARTKICFEPDNPGSSGLYLSVGFEPVTQTDILSGPTSERAS
jgi:GNAT superfamily N-acetyltransferase